MTSKSNLCSVCECRAPIGPIFPIYSYIFYSFLYFPILFKIPIFSNISEKLFYLFYVAKISGFVLIKLFEFIFSLLSVAHKYATVQKFIRR